MEQNQADFLNNSLTNDNNNFSAHPYNGNHDSGMQGRPQHGFQNGGNNMNSMGMIGGSKKIAKRPPMGRGNDMNHRGGNIQRNDMRQDFRGGNQRGGMVGGGRPSNMGGNRPQFNNNNFNHSGNRGGMGHQNDNFRGGGGFKGGNQRGNIKNNNNFRNQGRGGPGGFRGGPNDGQMDNQQQIQGAFFKTQMCPQLINGLCKKGDNCSYAHSQQELRQKPNLTKTKLCVQFQMGKCQMGSNCQFAHGEMELRSTPDLYKTQLCQNYLQNRQCPHGQKCRYAHGEHELSMKQNFIGDQQFQDYDNQNFNQMNNQMMPPQNVNQNFYGQQQDNFGYQNQIPQQQPQQPQGFQQIPQY